MSAPPSQGPSEGPAAPPTGAPEEERGGTLPKRYDPSSFEAKWQDFWEEKGLFRAPDLPEAGPHWTIVFPPPNVTGILTFGHSLQGATEDLLCRWQRMKGVPTLFLPGVDHAGVATQMAVRRHLEKQGVNVTALSKEELHARIEEWRKEKEQYIRRQLTAHGLSMDWSRYTYTMEPRYVLAVRTAFLSLFRAGLVYRAERMINWDPKLLTALSDLEVIPTETHGKLWYIRYPSSDPAAAARGEGLVVATTRPETMFGDVAVAVNPADERQQRWIGQKVVLPLTDRSIPVVTDPAIDLSFGTGALKVTPSHDRVDHEIALRHPELPSKRDTLDERGRLCCEFVPERFRGVERFTARKAIVEELREAGLLVKEEPHTHNVGHSERSEVPIEPRLSTQWFVDTSKMGLRALEVVRSGEVKIVPDRWVKTYYNFMENLEPWCISRQVVWGHEIPVWYCDGCGAFDAFESAPTKCPKCGGGPLHQDPDVLDTWFSSWLWPFATLGWPSRTRDLAAYYPVSVLSTGSDIVFFWVARMIMGGLQFLDTPPFPAVFLTGILTDRQGRKLSKHLGNSPDPLELIEKWGADAFRFALLFPVPVEDGGAWDPQRMMEGGRNFLTKLWNLARLVLSSAPRPSPAKVDLTGAPLMDRWLASRWSFTAQEVESRLTAYDLTGAAGTLHQFLWHEMADWWAEAAKDRLLGREGPDAQARASQVAVATLERTLRILHPFVPHITEELWQGMPHEGVSLAVARWPAPEDLPRDLAVEAEGAALQELVRALRTLRSDAKVPPDARPPAFARARTPAAAQVLARPSDVAVIVQLARIGPLTPIASDAPDPTGARALVTAAGEIFLLAPAGEGASAEEPLALRKERELISQLLAKTRARLSDPTFRQRAPPKVLQEAEAKEKELADRLAKLERHEGAATPAPKSDAP